MVLKRQTVWLLTMLSLIIVLSVYYISMERIQNQGVLGDMDEENEETNGSDENSLLEELEGLDEEDIFVNLDDVTDVFGEHSNFNNVTTDQLFETFRLQRMESRSKMNEEYVTAMVSEAATPELQVEALQKFENLQVLAQNEEMLESVLRSKGYDDA